MPIPELHTAPALSRLCGIFIKMFPKAKHVCQVSQLLTSCVVLYQKETNISSMSWELHIEYHCHILETTSLQSMLSFTTSKIFV